MTKILPRQALNKAFLKVKPYRNQNDSNTLDQGFYSELLHIIGLTETKEGGKKLIQRQKPGSRNPGSLIENAISQLDSLDKISRIEKPEQFGLTEEDRLFNVALELAITWINRILFLKLLEAQLIRYHKHNRSFGFLNLDKVKNYDDLNTGLTQLAQTGRGGSRATRQFKLNQVHRNTWAFELLY